MTGFFRPPVWFSGLLLPMQPAGAIEPEPPTRSHRAAMSAGLVVEAIDRHLQSCPGAPFPWEVLLGWSQRDGCQVRVGGRVAGYLGEFSDWVKDLDCRGPINRLRRKCARWESWSGASKIRGIFCRLSGHRGACILTNDRLFAPLRQAMGHKARHLCKSRPRIVLVCPDTSRFCIAAGGVWWGNYFGGRAV